MSDFPELYKLRITDTPFTAERIIDDILQSSPECQLPTDVPLDLALTPQTVVLPPLECTFNNITPIIPLPDFCHPHVTGSITASSCNPSLLTASSTVAVTQINDCDFQLGGSITVCPGAGICTDFATYSSLAVNVTGNGITGDGYLNMFYGACGFELDGGISIASSIVCAKALSFGGTVAISGTGLSGSIELSNTDSCGAELSGDLTLDVKCPHGVTTSGTVSWTPTYPLTGSGIYLYLTKDTDCNIKLNGTIDISIAGTFQTISVCNGGVTTNKSVLML